MKQVESDFVCVPIPTSDFLAVVHFLRDARSSRTPSELFCMAAGYLRDNVATKPDDLGHLLRAPAPGYMWKDVLLPSGTEVRMKYKGEWHYAFVDGGQFLYQGQPFSPSQFANTVTRSSRNAWRDLFIKRPGDGDWLLADTLRRRPASSTAGR